MHGCVRVSDGGVRCFGFQNDAGQLGSGDTLVPADFVTDVSGITDVEEIAAGAEHGCATFADGGYTCWGSNTWGQLGTGDTNPKLAP